MPDRIRHCRAFVAIVTNTGLNAQEREEEGKKKECDGFVAYVTLSLSRELLKYDYSYAPRLVC